ncbi:MAG: class I SAM-dependent methyltransferase [Acetobacteraceae bacterium]|nr:class I SAM-dependent methyltransferase [Acetobacteraceae bacterium]
MRLVDILITPLRAFVGYHQKRQSYLSYVKRKFGSRFANRDCGPMAPRELIETEALMQKDDLHKRATPTWYFGSGYNEARAVLSTAEAHGLDLSKLKAVLEFGCGSARVLRHFRVISGIELTGTDANPKPIAWNRRHLPGINFALNALEPPLPFAEESFDLIYALSVFTHIPLQWQKPWLLELRRIVRPGGYLLCTVHGSNYAHQLSEHDRNELGRGGAVTFDANSTRASYSSKVLGSWDVFQSRAEVRDTFSDVFELLRYTDEPFANGQDVLVLRKRADSARTGSYWSHIRPASGSTIGAATPTS